MSRIALMLLTLAPASALAQLYGEPAESPRTQQIEIKFGLYTPQIDSEGLAANPYARIFDNDSMFLSKIEYDYQVYRDFGSLAIGGELGYGQVAGSGLASGTTSSTSDETKLHILPMSLALVYHFDVLAVRWSVPLVPYVKVGLDYHIWWITDGVGDTSEYVNTDAAGEHHTRGSGDTFGWHVAAGLKLLLDDLAPGMARTFDNEVGVNNTYLFGEFLYADISDFGSSESFQLGDTTALFGLAFEF